MESRPGSYLHTQCFLCLPLFLPDRVFQACPQSLSNPSLQAILGNLADLYHPAKVEQYKGESMNKNGDDGHYQKKQTGINYKIEYRKRIPERNHGVTLKVFYSDIMKSFNILYLNYRFILQIHPVGDSILNHSI